MRRSADFVLGIIVRRDPEKPAANAIEPRQFVNGALHPFTLDAWRPPVRIDGRHTLQSVAQIRAR
jgi:hypothetical protein